MSGSESAHEVLLSGQRWWDRWAHGEHRDLRLNRWLPGCSEWEWRIVEGVARDIVEKLELSLPTGRLVEVGCGNGLLLSRVAGRVATLVAVDFSHGMLAAARRLLSGRARLCQALADRLPYPDAVFDRTLCYNVFPNFPDLAYGRRVIAELVRVTRPGGVVLIGGIPNEARKRELVEAARHFWAARQTASQRVAARILGRPRAVFHEYWMGLRRKVVRSLGGSLPRITFLYYDAEYFVRALDGSPHRCEILPSYFLYQSTLGGRERRDYRLDVRIRVGVK